MMGVATLPLPVDGIVWENVEEKVMNNHTFEKIMMLSLSSLGCYSKAVSVQLFSQNIKVLTGNGSKNPDSARRDLLFFLLAQSPLTSS
jgi:hypothetical protein